MGSLLKTVADQKLSLGVSGNAAVSIAGLTVAESAMDESSMREGSLHPVTLSIVAHAHERRASSQVTGGAPPLRCQTRPVISSVTWLPLALTVYLAAFGRWVSAGFGMTQPAQA